MSAFISCQTSDGVVILTDGAVYDAENRLTAVRRKIEVSDTVPVAIATRGHVQWGGMVAGQVISLVERHGFDLAMQLLGETLHLWQPREDLTDAIEVLVAGISESQGPRHLVFRNIEDLGEEPLKLHHPGPTCFGVATGAPDVGLSGIGVQRPLPGEAPEAYFAANGAQIMQFFREHAASSARGRPFEGGPAHLIGGQLDMTIVKPEGVSTRTIHRWDDKVGERIDPFTDRRTVVSYPAGMNRRERRVATRAARKCAHG